MKELIKTLQQLIDKHGYWSDEVRSFNETLDFTTMHKINQLIN